MTVPIVLFKRVARYFTLCCGLCVVCVVVYTTTRQTTSVKSLTLDSSQTRLGDLRDTAVSTRSHEHLNTAVSRVASRGTQDTQDYTRDTHETNDDVTHDKKNDLKSKDQIDENFQEPGPFHEIRGTGIWLYSVFYEHPRSKKFTPGIRAIGLAPESVKMLEVFCHVVFDNDVVKTSKRRMEFAEDSHNKELTAIYLKCSVPEGSSPRGVSFSLHNDASEGHRFTVVYPQDHVREFCVCYPVLYGAYSDFLALQQSFEFTRVMGAEHIFIYTQNTTSEVTSMLSWYQRQGLATVLKVPANPANQAWYYGQILAINDCHYRARYSCRYVAVQDVDEYILPLRHATWREMLAEVTVSEAARSFGRTIASFSFRNAFYCATHIGSVQWAWLRGNLSLTDEEVGFVNKTEVALFVEMHHVSCYPFPTRSKSIYRPEFVKEPGIHRARSFWSNGRYVVVDTAVGFLAHHRKAPEPDCSLDMMILPFFRQYLQLLMTSYKTFISTIDKSKKFMYSNR